ncbi:MAG: DUF962 domain-containing protein [Pseudomonadota bacterium]|nr:DUF962 domain-containing protein [Pseudomonadota bacterium]
MENAIEQRIGSFAEFYPFYLTQHANRLNRELHFAGSTIALLCLAALALTGNLWWGAAALVAGYGFAWAGHWLIEKNRPATLRQPLYSLMADWLMYWQMLTGQTSF